MIHILITFGDRCRKIAKPASYRDLIVKARKEFPMMSSVACLVVMFYPRSTDETIPRVKMVELDSNAYGSVKDGEVLFFNYHPADVERMFARSGKEMHVKDAAAELQGAFDALAARPPIDAISGRHTDGAWVGSDAAKQCSQQTENVLAGGAGLDNSGMGAGTQGWGQMSASDRRDTRPACHGRLGTGPESSTSSGKTAQFPEHHDPFQPPPPPPGWPTASLTEGSNQNNDFQEFRTSQQNENVGNVSDILYSGPVYHPAAAVEWIPKFNYGRPNGQSFQKLVAPGATGPTHLVSLELREREAAIHQAKQAHQHRRMIQTRDIQQQRLLLLEMADQLQRKLDLDKESHGTEAVSGAQPGAQPGSGKDAC